MDNQRLTAAPRTMTFSGFVFVARKRAAVVTHGNRALVATEDGTVRATNLESIILSSLQV